MVLRPIEEETQDGGELGINSLSHPPKQTSNLIRNNYINSRYNQIFIVAKLALINAFNSSFNILSRNGEYLQGSNVVDLVDYTLKKEKNIPRVDDFVWLLHRANIPPEMITNQMIKHKLINIQSAKSNYIEDEPMDQSNDGSLQKRSRDDEDNTMDFEHGSNKRRFEDNDHVSSYKRIRRIPQEDEETNYKRKMHSDDEDEVPRKQLKILQRRPTNTAFSTPSVRKRELESDDEIENRSKQHKILERRPQNNAFSTPSVRKRELESDDEIENHPKTPKILGRRPQNNSFSTPSLRKREFDSDDEGYENRKQPRIMSRIPSNPLFARPSLRKRDVEDVDSPDENEPRPKSFRQSGDGYKRSLQAFSKLKELSGTDDE